MGDILYHAPERRPLQDVLTAIREKTTVDALGFKRERFMDRALKSPAEMERRFALFPDAIQATADIAAACRFDLGEIRYQYPYEEVMAGRSEEHTSELQSLMRISYAVFCLKKKRRQTHDITHTDTLNITKHNITD